VKGKFPWGEGVALSGEQALIYSRVSQIDENRTDRQRAVILAILESARRASPGQVVKALDGTLRYVYTDLPEDEVRTLGKDALTQGWLGYDVVQLRTPVLPGEEGKPTGLSADINGQRAWIVDYGKEAKRVQEAIYGFSTVEEAKGPDYVADLFR
jgi:anionic cell wall polymer biosynthesis LytR-Cps2A-Psr (LCP) family protein